MQQARIDYDPLMIFRERISSQRKQAKATPPNDPHVPPPAAWLHQPEGNASQQTGHKARKSVIQLNSLQGGYSIPVSNPFDVLEN